MLTDLDLMELYVNVLYKHDENKRLTVINELPYEEVPLVFIGGTKSTL